MTWRLQLIAAPGLAKLVACNSPPCCIVVTIAGSCNRTNMAFGRPRGCGKFCLQQFLRRLRIGLGHRASGSHSVWRAPPAPMLRQLLRRRPWPLCPSVWLLRSTTLVLTALRQAPAASFQLTALIMGCCCRAASRAAVQLGHGIRFQKRLQFCGMTNQSPTQPDGWSYSVRNATSCRSGSKDTTNSCHWGHKFDARQNSALGLHASDQSGEFTRMPKRGFRNMVNRQSLVRLQRT